jgi:indolepyruvate ferredoxin oxidoreductase
MRPLFTVLASIRGVRHTPFDPFSWSAADRRERALTAWFDVFALRIVAVLTAATTAQVAVLLDDISRICGYGSVRAARANDIIPRAENTLSAIEFEHMADARMNAADEISVNASK